jgi:hypothetical protein
VKISDPFFVQFGKLADIGPGCKAAALSEEKKGFYFPVRFVFFQTGLEILQDRAVDRIESLGSVQRDPKNVAILLKQNQRHFSLSLLRVFSPSRIITPGNKIFTLFASGVSAPHPNPLSKGTGKGEGEFGYLDENYLSPSVITAFYSIQNENTRRETIFLNRISCCVMILPASAARSNPL